MQFPGLPRHALGSVLLLDGLGLVQLSPGQPIGAGRMDVEALATSVPIELGSGNGKWKRVSDWMGNK